MVFVVHFRAVELVGGQGLVFGGRSFGHYLGRNQRGNLMIALNANDYLSISLHDDLVSTNNIRRASKHQGSGVLVRYCRETYVLFFV